MRQAMLVDVGELLRVLVFELPRDAQGQFALRFELDLVQTDKLAELLVTSCLHRCCFGFVNDRGDG